MASDNTTSPSYWFNWRVLLCSISVSGSIAFSLYLIWKYEGRSKSSDQSSEDDEQEEKAVRSCVYEDEIWETCSESIRPVWLCAYRTLSFVLLLATLFAVVITNYDADFYLYYTNWTFALVTIYFGLASVRSFDGVLIQSRRDEKQKTFTNAKSGENADMPNCRSLASTSGYAMQIIFQISAGAVVLTDLVFWALIYPSPGYPLTFLIVCVHSINAVFLLGDAILNNCLRFPFFRIAYFILWTCAFVAFNWILHVFVDEEWPYSFLELHSPFAPLWYFVVGLVLLPCYGLFALVFLIKRWCLSKFR